VEGNGDAYYGLPEGPILYLYPDGTWHCEGEAPQDCQTIEEYLAWLEPQLRDIRGG
jgi:hypothetical protein